MYQPKTFEYTPEARDYTPLAKRSSVFVVIGILLAITFIAACTLLFFAGEFAHPFQNLYLLPWVGLVTAVVAAPPIYLAYRRKFDLFHPLVFTSWSYFFMAFVIGGLILAAGLSHPYYLTYVPNQEYYLPLTFAYIALGYVGLTLGFALPLGKRIGTFLTYRLPLWNWEPREVLWPGVALLSVGMFFNFSAFTAGIIGYQRSLLVDTFDATLAFFTYFVSFSSFMLWYAIFRVERRTFQFNAVMVVLICLVPYSTLLSGTRGGLIQNLLPIGMAFWLSGRRIKLHHGIIFGLILTVAVLIGVVYGTTFRSVKGAEGQVDAATYFDSSSRAVEIMNERGIGGNMTFALETLAERLETASSLAVVVANYEQLESYAGDYGLAGNIWTYTWTAFIPRLAWPDKPIISDARAYSALYFDYGDNSFAITPIGDLLRNFGPWGVPIGMAILGFFLRIMYVALIESGNKSVWRSAGYFLLLTKISYEGFYGTILPDLLRMSAIVIFAGLLMNFMIHRTKNP